MLRAMVMVVALVFWASMCLAQSQRLLQITSPADGTIVYAGQTVTVSVTGDPSVSIAGILGRDPIGFAGPPQPTVGPVQISLTIPPNIPIDHYHIIAVGLTADDRDVASAPITLFVENRLASGVRSIRAEPGKLWFKLSDTIPPVVPSLRHFIPLRVVGTLPDGSKIVVSHSVSITYVSSNPKVATVDKRGVVTAVGYGKAVISIRFGEASTVLAVEVR